MHELALTESVLHAIRQRLGDTRVVRVRLEIGRLMAVMPEALRFAFDTCTQGTPLGGARLEIDEIDARGRCRACAREALFDGAIPLCACGSADIELFAGRELHIKEVEVA